MKKLLFLSLLSLSFAAHANCSINSVRTSTVVEALKSEKWDGWDLKNYDVICAKLAKAKARLQISGQATVLNNISIGWVSIALMDANVNIGTADYGRTNTHTNTTASQNVANSLLVKSMHAAVDGWDNLDEAIAALNMERAKLRKQ